MSKHTPGPWQLDEKTVGRYKSVNIENSNGVRIASTGHSPFDLIEKQSNARLITAAPDLLEAARSALMLIRGSGFTENSNTLIALKSAIAKAEGKD